MLTNDPNKYHPEVCGDCKCFRAIERSVETGGRMVGECTRLECETTRTDWCHDPEDIKKRQQAMDAYVVQGGHRND